MDIAPSVTTKMSAEAFGSPQLMQTICLNLCFETKHLETLPNKEKIEVNDFTLGQVFERTSAFMDFVSLVEALHAGPKQRGVERKQFDSLDSSKGDVYRAVLLAITSPPPKLAFTTVRYAETRAHRLSGRKPCWFEHFPSTRSNA